mmetsp:Transcript_49602/g.124376  ORF Transcript_49602/g.124376 Transcript_49602/m.124376 type:complete len:103 (-) Transcript_49602:193-501(-)
MRAMAKKVYKRDVVDPKTTDRDRGAVEGGGPEETMILEVEGPTEDEASSAPPSSAGADEGPKRDGDGRIIITERELVRGLEGEVVIGRKNKGFLAKALGRGN